MRKLIRTAIALLMAAPLLASAPAEAAKRKKSVAPQKSVVDTYYYRGTGTVALYDRSRPFFGSPVRGREFFDAVAARAPQN